jgi:hypothetical protein
MRLRSQSVRYIAGRHFQRSAIIIGIMIRRVRRLRLLLNQIATFLLLCSTLPAQESCPAEVKLLLSPTQTQAAVKALGARGEAKGKVYLFDTGDLALLRQGVIVRLRQGASNDLMVKVRPATSMLFADPSGGRENYKCEIDVSGGQGQPSYSIARSFEPDSLPVTGKQVVDLLSEGQKKLLEQARATIDWSQVKRVVEIDAVGWQVKSEPGFGKLALELWKYPGGEVLELSTKVEAKRSAATYTDLQELATNKRLAMEKTQKLKTTLVLRSSNR